MNDWSQGYPTDTAYMDSVQAEIAPARWGQALTLANRQGPATDRPFRFLELGCGSAQTLIGLAACYPQAEFLGVDFMPEHVVRARRLIDEAELPNVRVEEADFAAMAGAPPEARFDFAAAHGVWTWVDADVRAAIVQALDAWLAPGAVAYFGYNAAAGWAAAAPLRQIFRAAPRGPGDAPFAAARRAVDRWIALRQDESADAARLWAKLSDASDAFLAHELGSAHGTGIWHEEIAAALTGAKMGYACPAVLAEGMDALFLEDEAVDWLREAAGQGWGETARDLAHRRTFRNDLFHRGAPAIGGAEATRGLLSQRMAAWSPEDGFGAAALPLDRLTRTLDDDLLGALQQTAGPDGRPLGEILDALGIERTGGMQAGLMALAACALIDLRPPAEAEAAMESCARFNRVVRRRLDEERAPVQGLAAPALGGCITLRSPALRGHLSGETPDRQVADRLARLGVHLD